MGRRKGIAVVAAVMAAVAGCGSSSVADPSSPVPITSTSQASSTSPTASTASPSASPTLDPNSDAAIIAAVHAYAAAYEAVARTASLKPLLPVSEAGCNCRQGLESFVEKLQRAHAKTDARVNATKIVIQSKDNRSAKVSLMLTVSAYRVLTTDGRVIAMAPAAIQPLTFDLHLTEGRWLVYLSA